MANWPGGLPPLPLQGTLQTSPEDIRDVFEPDLGPDIIRRVAQTAGENLAFSISLTDDQYTPFTTFWDDTTNHGADTFTWVHPVTGASETFRFTALPKITNRSEGAHIAAIRLYQLP